MALYFMFRVCVFLLCLLGTLSITTEYFNQVCDVSRTVDTSLRLESSTSLAYTANTACYYTVTADSAAFVFLVIRHFELENEVIGACVDYVNIHDGSDVSATTLNASPLCSRIKTTQYYTSTGNQMTIYFQSDNTGQYSGFEMIFSRATTGTCSSSQTACTNNSVCIDSSLKCNTIDECGDGTDEDGCIYPSVGGVKIHPLYAIIIGVIVGLIALTTFCVLVGHWLWRNNKWRWLMNRPVTADKVELQPTTYETAYPVTQLYYKDRFKGMYPDPEAVQHPGIHDYQITQLNLNHGEETRVTYQSI